MKEAAARIKINKLLENAGWRFFADTKGPANVQLEPSVTLTKQVLDDLGENFEKASKGFIDFLLLNEKSFPFIVLEAKAEDKNPLVGKEQARKYAKSQNCRFVILSNGNLHYFWDLERGNPYVITAFPTPTSVTGYQKSVPDPKRLIEEVVADDYVVLTQRPNYASEAAWKSEAERPRFIEVNSLRFLRPYQKKAIYAIQAVKKGSDRFLLEMATGTGKTLTAAALIKLFLRTGNAHRVLFLVDRLELEDQGLKAFKKVLANDYKSIIYKENRDDCRHAEIVVTTAQSLLFNNKYQQVFSPTDFDLVISDEAHRSTGGNARAVFDCFNGYKLGLTAPKKTAFKLFDFFANCEYFEEEFDYDQVLKLPKPRSEGGEENGDEGPTRYTGTYEHLGDDLISTLKEETIGYEGMRIDREFYAKFEDVVRENDFIAASVEAGQWDRVIDYVNKEVFDKPSEHYSLEKLRKAVGVDRRLTLREILEKIFGFIPRFKSKDDLLEEEFSKFVADYKPDEAEAIPALETYFKAYAASDAIRHIIESGQLTDLATNPVFSTKDFKAVPAKYRTLIPDYIKDYVSLNQFAA